MGKLKKKIRQEEPEKDEDVESKPKKKKKKVGAITKFTVSENELELFKEIAGRGNCKINLKPVHAVEGNVASKDCVITFNSKNTTLTIDGR